MQGASYVFLLLLVGLLGRRRYITVYGCIWYINSQVTLTRRVKRNQWFGTVQRRGSFDSQFFFSQGAQQTRFRFLNNLFFSSFSPFCAWYAVLCCTVLHIPFFFYFWPTKESTYNCKGGGRKNTTIARQLLELVKQLENILKSLNPIDVASIYHPTASTDVLNNEAIQKRNRQDSSIQTPSRKCTTYRERVGWL